MDPFTPLDLPGGTTLPNRLAKAAMEESLASQPGQLPGARMERLYARWARGGVGLIITGNVMVDRRALTSPGTVVLDARSPLEPFRRWARAASSGGAQVWMQINHPGRQVGSDMPGTAWAPSDVRVSLGKHTGRFARPTAMTEADIRSTITRFATTARRAEEAGFHGVQIHAAHGYLLSQFLSPLVNRRTDQWGGPLEHRARLLTEILAAVRTQVAPGFAVAVKLNAADFQRGGFDTDDAARVLDLLGGLGVDLVELSGGSVESPASMGHTSDHRVLEREAYFLALAERLLETATVPLMLTGGIARRTTAEKALERGVSVVGMGTALALHPDLPERWRAGEDVPATIPRLDWKDRSLACAATLAYVRHQLDRVARGSHPRPQASARRLFLLDSLQHRRRVRAYRTWLTSHPDDTREPSNH
ncbi:NADH:flavin oxidoreductase/NADH oxidase family protein [Streptomyces sp. NBC_00091]|uniref:NADH:flavin oxidoreductase/NADH oxidase family protein n=1 Tax=Streptomyces sp. NBC_00091 TaxID=2975648 RepID=UPI00225A3765|nr:NADH:flavin oxidoreductase/NADH oxidase family protein [Streptomyces sp. NBC_00091]MCX5380391.1 NADH:flavin oxidoreductase/NADH oxidase family protein [Streptomyces sp. NBC_00091]